MALPPAPVVSKLKVKLFHGPSTYGLDELENSINEWLEENKDTISCVEDIKITTCNIATIVLVLYNSIKE